jgi:hypothetical protein
MSGYTGLSVTAPRAGSSRGFGARLVLAREKMANTEAARAARRGVNTVGFHLKNP